MKRLPHTSPTLHVWPHPAWPALALTLAVISAPAWPHGGEDHGDERADAPPTQQAPRASAQTDAFELVAVLDPGDTHRPAALTIYLDKVDTNEPVAKASIDVESGAFKASATPVAPGVYSVPAAALAKPGRYPLTFTVQSGDNADLLDATLVSRPHEDRPEPPPAASHARWPWLVAGAALLILAAWLARRFLARSTGPARHTA